MLIRIEQDQLKNYLEDSSNLKSGSAEKVVIPESVEELGRFLSQASSDRLPVTVSGGGTGTTGARVPFGGAVLSLERFNRIVEIVRDDAGGIARVEAGATVDDLKKAAHSCGLFYTCHPTETTATVGGTIATNASGARSFRYGATRVSVLGLTVVLATGEAMRLRRGQIMLTASLHRFETPIGRTIDIPLPSYRMPEVKNAAGYFSAIPLDLVDLFIGQEGTLGIVTEAEIRLEVRPRSICSYFSFFDNEQGSWDFAERAKEKKPLSIEYFDNNTLGLLRTKGHPIGATARAAIFIEDDDPSDTAVDRWRELFFEFGVSEDNIWAAMTEKEAEKFQTIRHAVPSTINEILRRRGFQKVATDIAVPSDRFREMMVCYAQTLERSGLEYLIFGHIGESHLHVNILPRSDAEVVQAKETALSFVKRAVSMRGTVSAEHGIGKIKHRYLEEMYGRKGLEEMARIKRALDPACILGLDTVFPKELLRIT